MNDINRKIRVLHYGCSSNYGGIENIVFSLFSKLYNYVDFDFINEGEDSIAYENDYLNKGCRIYKVANRFKNPIKHVLDIKKILTKNNYDYVHCHTMHLDEPTMIVLSNELSKTQVIIHCHSNYYLLNKEWKQKVLELFTNLFIKNIDYLKLSCSYSGGYNMFANNEFCVIENGVDLEKFRFSDDYRNYIRGKYSISKNAIVIGHVGKDNYEKNHSFILSVFKELIKINDKYRLLLVGDTSSLNSQISDLGLADFVIQTGLVNDVHKYYSAMDIFFFPSLYEGFPVATIEAQKNGLPCFISDKITREVKVCDNAIFISLDLQDSVNSILNCKLNNRNNIIIDKKYDISTFADKILKYYNEHFRED